MCSLDHENQCSNDKIEATFTFFQCINKTLRRSTNLSNTKHAIQTKICQSIRIHEWCQDAPHNKVASCKLKSRIYWQTQNTAPVFLRNVLRALVLSIWRTPACGHRRWWIFGYLSSGSFMGVSAKSSPDDESSSRINPSRPFEIIRILHVAISLPCGGTHSSALQSERRSLERWALF